MEKTLEERKKFYHELAEADMFERDVAKYFKKFILHIQKKEDRLRAKMPFFLKNARRDSLCRTCFFLHMKTDKKGHCIWRHLSNEECALLCARIWVEILWELNKRGV